MAQYYWRGKKYSCWELIQGKTITQASISVSQPILGLKSSIPFDNLSKPPYFNLSSKSPVPLPPCTSFSTDHFVSYTYSENIRKSVRTALTLHVYFYLDPSFISLLSQGRSVPSPVRGQSRALSPVAFYLLTDFADSGRLSAPFRHRFPSFFCFRV